MRVLHAVHAYPPDVGGSEAVVARLSEGLEERGHSVEVATSEHAERGSHVNGVRVHGFDPGPVGVARYRRFVHRGVKEDRWDVVMTYHSKVFTHLSLYPFRVIQDRWVYCPTEFTDVESGALRHRVYYGSVEPRSLRMARRAVVLTQADEAKAASLSGGEAEVRVIPNGVDHAWWSKGDAGDVRSRLDLPSSSPLVVYAGGLWEHKDVETLVAAIGRLREVHLVLAGDEKGRLDEIKQRARKVGAPNRVHVVGRLDRETLRALYHASDVFASASSMEGFGLVFLEAMACGLPVVARDVGVIPELVDEGAEIIQAEDANGFARAIETMLGQASEKNKTLARAYDWEHIVDAWEDLYAEVAP